MQLTIEPEAANSPIATQLIAELSAELGAIYGDDGDGGFDPSDVMVPRAAFVVAWADGQAVGCGALRPMPDATIAEIKRVYVCSSMRGRGISRQIMNYLENSARQFGYIGLMLETGIQQPAAMALYENMGYARCDCYSLYADDPRSVCYRKELK
ncbi:MAG: GNAT family N-acetyltransferase [Anaerolineaceae bacterium]|nr:GNAT family N-acetyltransferase [Anaerolineaceae bacterium]